MVKTPLTAASATHAQLLHDARAIADAVEIDLQAIAAEPYALWVIVETEPELNSGGMTLPDAAIDATTGTTVRRSGAGGTRFQAVTMHEGVWRVTDVISGSLSEPTGYYGWTQPRRSLARISTRDDVYDPFTIASTFLCRIEGPVESGASPFKNVAVLPQGWARVVADAVLIAGRRDEGSSGAATPTIRRQMFSRVHSHNHVVFATALARLAQDYALGPGTFDELLEKEEGYRRAVVYYVALRAGHYLNQRRVVRSLSSAWLGDKEADHRRAAMLGLVAAVRVGGLDVGPYKQVKFHAARDADSYVRMGLNVLGF